MLAQRRHDENPDKFSYMQYDIASLNYMYFRSIIPHHDGCLLSDKYIPTRRIIPFVVSTSRAAKQCSGVSITWPIVLHL